MKISLLNPDLSTNCLARAHIFAKVLERHYEVEIIGPKFQDRVWDPLDTEESSYKAFPGRPFPQFLLQVPRILKAIEGDIVWVNTPCFTSFGIGIIKKLISNRPLILDIADWEAAFYRHPSEPDIKAWFITLIKNLKSFVRFPNSYYSILINEKLTFLADEITVSNSFLQRKFGGTIVRHCRNVEDLDPGRYSKHLERERLQINQQKKVIVFLGTPHPYKGLEDLVEAVDLLGDPRIMLMLVGLDQREYSKKLRVLAERKLGVKNIAIFGRQPFDSIPRFLAASDLVVIPQKRTIQTIGQLPAKVFDAMAMAKPIIATAVSDLPEILDGCGWIVEPDNPEQLAEAIQYVLDHPAEAEEMGWRAREKCVEKYSWDAMEKILLDIFRKYE